MATTAAVVTAAAAVGSAAYSASQSGGGKGGGGAPTMDKMAPWERIFNRATADINDEERRVMEDALAQASWMQPEMYKLLGYEPIYDDRGVTPEALADLSGKVDILNKAQQEGKIAVQESTIAIKEKRQQLKKLKGKKHRAERKQLKEEIRELQITRKEAKQSDGPLQKEAAAAQKMLSDAQTLPRRVVGVRKLEDGPVDPTGDPNYRQAFELQNEALVRALKGEEPVDATLRTAWDEKERTLRERLRRQLGTDYETSTAGAQALANFDRERNESFEAYNTNLARTLSSETESRAASLSDLTSARMQQLLYPSNAQAARALQLGQVAGDRLGIAGLYQHERLAQFEGKRDAYNADAANAAARAQAIGDLMNATGQGVGAGGAALDRYLGSQPASPTTVNVPTY